MENGEVQVKLNIAPWNLTLAVEQQKHWQKSGATWVQKVDMRHWKEGFESR